MARPRTVVDTDSIVAAYLAGTSISAIAIDHDISRDIVRRVVADLVEHDENGGAKILCFPMSSGPIAPEGQVTSVELVQRAGITYRQLDYWARCGYLRSVTAETPGSGHARFFEASEIAVAALVRRFLADGVTPQAAFRLTRQLTETGTALLAGIRIDLPEPL